MPSGQFSIFMNNKYGKHNYFMKQHILLLITIIFCFSLYGQPKDKGKKYPSVFWEITGNGLKKPSYLFGTMHVSSKIAFHLSDSFYMAVKNADVVALETNPETWQEDMNKYELPETMYGYDRGNRFLFDTPQEYLYKSTLAFDKYEKKLEIALFSRPQVINNLLYRSLSDYTSDFEEDTYLDLYIYQTGKKMGKQVAGVENYAESMRLMAEAFRDAAKDKNRKERSFDYDEDYSPAKLQDAYRSGNLDQLDSINRLVSQSDAFDEKFLYRRNEIQANSIDSILKRSSLFVGVGAAHLPGPRGVIELLRKKGYKLRPIFMSSRDSRHKDDVEKIRVPVSFSAYTSDDGFFKVDIPGKFYRFEESIIDRQQYADMANGSFYMVTRVKTNGLYWGHDANTVAKKIDSLLYENVPGKILSKTEITRNGYRGLDITNRTRRGDFQRYQVFITPFEVLFFKMSGNGDYVKNGEEAKKFFGSIQLRELKNGGWKKFTPAWGGFSVDFPQAPFESISDRVQYDAEDKSTGTHYSVVRTDIHNYEFAEEDTFDLTLMDESFASSEFIDKTISRRQHVYKGSPALDCHYRHKNGSFIFNRYIIKGPHYYMLSAHGQNESPAYEQFLNSFAFVPYTYKEIKQRKDSTMHFSVAASWWPEEKKEIIELPDPYSPDEDDEEEYDFGFFEKDSFKARLIKNDTTGEAVFVSFMKSPDYFFIRDSSLLDEDNEKAFVGNDSTWIIRHRKKNNLPGGMKRYELLLSDTGSSRAFRTKTWYKDGIGFALVSQVDTTEDYSSFIQSFFDNFTPADTLAGINPFEKKSAKFFSDFFSSDSVLRNKAIRSVSYVEFDSTDLLMLTRAIHSFRWSDKNYLNRKNSFIRKLASLQTKESADLLQSIYYAAGDTVQLQHTALETLLKQRTRYAYNLFRDIITTEPPVLDKPDGANYSYLRNEISFGKNYSNWPGISNNDFMDELYDSLPLTRTILPGLLPLMNLDDYKWPVMRLLRTMVDSNLVSAKDYEMYFSKFLIEAKQELKKQAIEEKKTSIEKAEEEKKEIKPVYSYLSRSNDDRGNEELSVYATLLLPFRPSDTSVVDNFINLLLASGDKRLKYNTLYLLLRNKKPVSDSLLFYFAGLDDYRYELYRDLCRLKLEEKFPVAFNNHRDLAKSKLLHSSYYLKPDSVVFLDSLPADYQGKTGWVYFFRYKQKKDDNYWKLASVGLIPKDPDQFIFDDEYEADDAYSVLPGWHVSYTTRTGGFTEFTDLKIKEDEPLADQLNRQLKKLLYSKRKSAKMFYADRPDAEERHLD